MPGNKRVCRGFPAPGEAGDSLAAAQRAELGIPPGQQLVRVSLVTDVPDNPVGFHVKNKMQRRRQLYRAEIGGQVSPGFGDGTQNAAPQLPAELFQLGQGHIGNLFVIYFVVKYHLCLRQPLLGGHATGTGNTIPMSIPSRAPAITSIGL